MHGDIRPDNITVEIGDDRNCRITGLLDWEYSGFYPKYYESIKVTNRMAPNEDDDRCCFLPECISPQKYKDWWLVDRLWSTLIE
jgi:hypothetical protein